MIAASTVIASVNLDIPVHIHIAVDIYVLVDVHIAIVSLVEICIPIYIGRSVLNGYL